MTHIMTTSPPLTTQMQQRLYPRIDRPRQIFLRKANELAAEANSIIDIGCGRTAPELQLIGSASQRRVGVDLVDHFDVAPSHQIECIRADCSQLPFQDHEFDLLVCKSVLEHLVSPDLSFREFARVLRPGGRALFLTPNRWDYVSLIASVIPNRFHPWIVKVTTGRSEEDTFPTFYLANSRSCITRLAAATGFAVETLDLLREHPHYLQFSLPTYLAGIAIEQLIQRPFSGLRPWLFIELRKT